MKKKFLRALLLLSLFSSLGFTAPVYVDCQDPEPDEWLDIFGMPQSITVLEVTLTTQPPTFFALVSDSHISQWRHAGTLSLQPFASEMALSVALRC